MTRKGAENPPKHRSVKPGGGGVRKRAGHLADSNNTEQPARVLEPEIVLEPTRVGVGGLLEPTTIDAEAVTSEELSSDLDAGLGEEFEGEEANTDVVPSALSSRTVSDKPIRADGRIGVSRDALTTYLKELTQYPLLSKEEEHELAVQYLTEKDRIAAYKLVTSNLWLVVKLAREYERAARNVLDLIQEGNIGLMEAVKNFDPYRGVRFPSYASWWIKAYIIRYLVANWRMVKIGTTQAQRKLFFNLKREKEKLEREGFYPAPALLAEKLNVRESDVVEMEQRLGGSDASLDAPIDSEDGGVQTLHGLLSSEAGDVEATVASREVQRIIAQAVEDFIGFLNERERFIFEQRILHGESTTLQEVSEKLDISRERVRQLEERLRKKLKEFMRERLGDESVSFGLTKG